jgi:hypothetical protein
MPQASIVALPSRIKTADFSGTSLLFNAHFSQFALNILQIFPQNSRKQPARPWHEF